MSKRKNEQEDKSKVKLYKTKHGWFSALTRFFKLFSFSSKKEVKATDFNDLDSLKNMHTSDTADVYKKGAATMATLLGAGVIGTTSPTEAHAATTTVDQSSQVIGSGSTSSSTSTSQSKTSTSESTTSTSNVSSGSTSSSTSTSESNISTSESTTSNSNVSSGSISTSTSAASSQSASTSTSLTSSSMSGSLANSETSSSSNDDFETFTKEASNNTATTAFSANQSLSLRTPTENIRTIALFNSSFIQTNATEEEGTANVSTADEFINAIKDSNISTIKLTANIDLGNLGKGDYKIPPHSFTIDGSNGNDKYELNIGYRSIWLNNTTTSKQYKTTIKSVKLYTADQGGFTILGGGAHTLIYDNVDATGGTAVRADNTTDLKVFEIRGNTTINGVNSYQYNGNTYTTGTGYTTDTGYTTLICGGNNLKIDDGASLTINNSITPFDITILGNNNEHVVSVGNNANLTINNTYNYRSGDNVANIALTTLPKGNASFIAGENSNINLNTSGTNIYFSGYYNNTATFNQGTNATLSGNCNFYFYAYKSTITINDPAHLTLNTTTGTTFSTYSRIFSSILPSIFSSPSVTVNAKNTNVVVTNNGVITESNYFGNNQSTVKETSYTTGTITDEQKDGNTSVENVMATINKSGTTKVEYNGKTIHSESISASASTSASIDGSISGSTSHSTEISISKSRIGSASLSESVSNSTSLSESRSGSVSLSESVSNSTSLSESLSNSVSMSESLSNSVSMSESLSNSVSMSESLSNSVSMSESLSNSVSMSESLSNSVSMSESLSNSVSMSESLSNSVSMSESLSNSVSMSESLSNSVSMSESLSNSVSMSESLSNSVSMSESLS
ncbi:serine-rich glycoprotein adhesin, partial [Limosilactobacillus reuteri]|uniref:serine-rich glycoprotein adhesin n=1 Tax=Limosilactobacillus reuteri TaxID=1598 RepID=UPI001CDD5F95